MAFKNKEQIEQILNEGVAAGAVQKPSEKLVNYTALYAAVERLKALSADEKDRAEGIEAGLQAALDKLNGADSAEGSVASAVKAEETRAKAAEKANSDAIALLNDGDNVEGSVAFAVKAEETRALEVEGDLQDAIDAEEAARIAQIGDLGKVSEEEGAADHTVKSFVEAKISAVTGDATVLSDRVSDLEATHATNEDGSFMTVAEEAEAAAKAVQDAIMGEGYSDTLDTIKAIQDWITENGADGEDGVVTLFEQVTANGNAISAEETRAKAAEKAISDYIGTASVPAGTDPEENPAKAATGLTAKVEDNAKAVADEASRAAAAEEAIETRLSKLASVVGADEKTDDVKSVVARLADLEAAVGEDGSVAAQIQDAIEALANHGVSGEDGAVKVTVTQVDGVVTEVAVEHQVVTVAEIEALFA